MKLQEILAIAGTPGLHQYVAPGRNGGIIVESLVDKKRTMVNGTAKVSALGDIAVFTDNEEVALADIFTNIYKANQGVVAIGNKSTNDELEQFISAILPDYDRDRVHMSDVKKIANWYNTLVSAGMTEFSLEEEGDEQTQAEEVAEAKSEEVVKKAAPKKAAAPKKPTAAPKASPKASGSKVTATKSTTVRKSQ